MATPTPTTQLPTVTKADEAYYVLYYRQGNNPHPQQKNFKFPYDKSMQKVVARCKRHCENVGIRFVNVRPWLSDLDQEENLTTSKEIEAEM